MTHTIQKFYTMQEAISERMPAERITLRILIIGSLSLFALYMYFVAVMVYKTVDRKIVETRIRDTRALVSVAETDYLHMTSTIDAEKAVSYGLSIPRAVIFAESGTPKALSLYISRDAF